MPETTRPEPADATRPGPRHRSRPGLGAATRGRVLFGGDYNPEQWPDEVWHEDIRLMQEAGVNSVTLGVFSWAKLEPRPGAREFGWLDTLMDLMHAGGIGVVLATPTSSPPPWMGRLHPETLPRDENGQVEWWGSRQHFSHSSAVYRRHAAAITEDLAARYGGHPALTMWHINNEYCTYDWGDEAAATFRDWLRKKYGTLDALNEAWGTAFWSQGYDGWHEILPPRRAHYMKNPTHVLDFKRFTSDMLLECYVIERDIVRRHTPHLPVTTNFMPMWVGQDAWRWAEEEDVVSVDIYPDPRDPFGAQNGALVQDMTRSQAGAARGCSWSRPRVRSTGAASTIPSPVASTACGPCRPSPEVRTPSATSSGGSPGRGRRSSTPPCSATRANRAAPIRRSSGSGPNWPPSALR